MMNNTRKIIIICERIISIVCVAFIFAFIWIGLRYLIVDDTNSYTRVMMHEFYDQDNIDIVFCGASLCYRSFDTNVLDSELKANTFNAGSSSQTIAVTYYLLKDCLDRYNVDHVFVELSPIMASIYKDDITDMTGVYIITDYMRMSTNKIQLLFAESDPASYANSFLIARRNWQDIYNMEYLGSLLEKKSSDIYTNYKYNYLKYDTEWYKGKGYVESEYQVTEGTFNDYYTSYDIKLENIDSSWFDYVNKIIALCEKKETKLTFVCAPLSEYLISYYGEDYDNYHNKISNIANQAGIEFWDFTLAKEDFFPNDAKYYMDSAHLNMYGAQILSKLIAQIIKGQISYKDICYSSTEEKILHDKPKVLGIVSSGNNIRIISTEDGYLRYQISVTTSDGKEYTIQDFSPNKEFSISEGESGIIHIISLDDNLNKNAYDYTYE